MVGYKLYRVELDKRMSEAYKKQRSDCTLEEDLSPSKHRFTEVIHYVYHQVAAQVSNGMPYAPLYWS